MREVNRLLFVTIVAGGIALGPACRRNDPPDTPSAPAGPASGFSGVSYSFSTTAADPDGDSIAYQFDWGDGDTSEWSAFVPSGDSVRMGHSWAEFGTYEIKAQARDASEALSPWSNAHPVRVVDAWTRTFGGSSHDLGYSVAQTADGGYIITGSSASYGAGSSDVWLIKTDASGNKTWDRTFGGSDWDFGRSVAQTADGGYIITGYTYSYGAGFDDVWLIKTDASGNKTWDRTFGGSSDDRGYSVAQTADGGYIITGETWSYGAGSGDAWLIKTDASGDTMWTRTYGGVDGDRGNSVVQTADGGYIITGYTYSYGAGSGDAWLIKTDASGDTMWTRTFGGESHDAGNSVVQTTDGGYVVAGFADGDPAGGAVWLIKTDASGDTMWTRTFGGESYDAGNSVVQTTDGGYVVAGYTFVNTAVYYYVWLIKTDAAGNKTWDRTFGGGGPDYGRSVAQTADGGYVVAGHTMSFGAGSNDVWLIKTDASGEVGNATWSAGMRR